MTEHFIHQDFALQRVILKDGRDLIVDRIPPTFTKAPWGTPGDAGDHAPRPGLVTPDGYYYRVLGSNETVLYGEIREFRSDYPIVCPCLRCSDQRNRDHRVRLAIEAVKSTSTTIRIEGVRITAVERNGDADPAGDAPIDDVPLGEIPPGLPHIPYVRRG
ncbi:hypothetical protein [Gordonia malaquae]|uniref:hypothetical protein n=1 Tax=Gordonia malaquae TaxID=410332 RepID=UPI003016F67A